MRIVIVISLSLLIGSVAFDAGAAVAKVISNPHYCDQKEYDEIYADIVKGALNQYDTAPELAIKTKNTTIFKLRALCRGQRSSYEVGL